MKKLIALFSVVITLCYHGFAQDKTLKSNSGFMGSVGLNFSFPAEKKEFPPESDIMGPTFFLTGGYVLSNYTALRTQFNYTWFADYFTKSDGSKLSGSFNTFAIKGEFLAGIFRRNAFIDVYGISGIGYYSFAQNKDGDIKLEKDEGNFGFVIGAGINYRLYKKLCISWEAEYNAIFNNSSLKGYFNISTLNLSFVP